MGNRGFVEEVALVSVWNRGGKERDGLRDDWITGENSVGQSSLRTLLRVYLLALPGAQRRGRGWTWKKPFTEETHRLGVGGGVWEDEHLVWGPGSDTSFLSSPGLFLWPPNGE